MEPTTSRIDARSAVVFFGVGALFVVLFTIVHVAAQALLLAFAGVLFGTSLRGAASWSAAKLHWRVRWTLVGWIALLVLVCVAAVLWVVPRLDDQIAALVDRVQLAYSIVRERASNSDIGRRILDGALAMERPMQYVGRAAGLLSSLIGALGGALIVVFVALYVAASPDVYRRGLLQLVPPPRRARMSGVLDDLSATLRRWMLGRLVSMTAVGVITTIALWLLGVPLALSLGVLAGALGFIPNIGPIVSAVPAMLLAATIDLPHVGYVAAVYLAVNLVDGYVLTPWIQKRSVATPAALTLIAQLVFGALWGVLGLTLATPLLACTLLIVRRLYVEDVLESAGRER
ncbi:MAG: AI-2E family transporter [Kofleriaceae bacterium]